MLQFDDRLLKRLRLLVVGSSSDERELLKFLFQECGAEVLPVPSATEAIAALDKFQLDILISELFIPYEDGYSLIRKIRSRSSKDSLIPALAFTCAASSQYRLEALSAGFDRYLSKPADINILVATVISLSHKYSVMPSEKNYKAKDENKVCTFMCTPCSHPILENGGLSTASLFVKELA